MNILGYLVLSLIVGVQSTSHIRGDGLETVREKRYAAFGTSRTWGVGVDREKETYIKLVSKEGRNYAIRASDATYPSMCAQSMIGDEIYDVIIVEYENRYKFGLKELIHRLRERFPEALIIMTDIFMYDQILVTHNNITQGFTNWLIENNIPKNTQEAYDFVATCNDAHYMFHEKIFQRDRLMMQLENDYNVKLIRWDIPDRLNHMKELILKFLPYYTEDFIHFSKEGHKSIAHSIKHRVEKEQKQRSNVIGTWGSGDFCSSWLENGIIPNVNVNKTQMPSLTLISPGIQMIQFDERKGKYALEFTQETNMLEIINPLLNTNSPQYLSFCYMATGPKTTIYPKAQLLITSFDVHHQPQPNTIIHPLVNSYPYPVHVQETKIIGKIQPGPNYIRLNILEDNKEQPFRLVGFSITNGETLPSDIYQLRSQTAYHDEFN